MKGGSPLLATIGAKFPACGGRLASHVWVPTLAACRTFLAVVAIPTFVISQLRMRDTSPLKPLFYLHEDHRLLEGPNCVTCGIRSDGLG
jgi:hypothetical protein